MNTIYIITQFTFRYSRHLHIAVNIQSDILWVIYLYITVICIVDFPIDIMIIAHDSLIQSFVLIQVAAIHQVNITTLHNSFKLA